MDGIEQRQTSMVDRRALLGGMAVTAGALALPARAQAPVRKILLLAGPKEHGPPGRHEYEKDLRELAWSLEHAANVRGVSVEVRVGKPPHDISLYEDADAIVVDGNGDWLKHETGMLFPQAQDTDGRVYDAENTAFLKAFDALLKRRQIGLSMFHYTMWNDNWEGRKYILDWLGGLWIPYASHNPKDNWAVRPLKVNHPILRGVTPWKMREEMYSRYFLFGNPRRTELLAATPDKPENGVEGPVAWAYDRPDGGRSFVWGGADFHDNLHAIADYRRFLLNALLWIAKVEVPAGGVQAPPQPDL